MEAFYLYLLFLIIYCKGDLVINSPSQNAKTYSSPSARLEDTNWGPIGGQLIALEIDACEAINMDATGKILMYKSTTDSGVNRCPYSTRLLNAQKAGAIAAVMMGDGLGSSAYIMNGLRIHGVTIANDKDLWDLAVNTNQFINSTVSPGSNSFQTFFKSEVPILMLSIVLGLYAFLCFCLSTWNFIGFLLYKTKTMGMPGIILGLEICSSIIRVIHMVDPVYSRGILSFPAISVLITLSNPFTFASVVLMSFYWEEATRKARTAMPSLYRFKYPSIIIIFFFFFITLLDSISRACYAGIPRLSIVTPVIFLLLSAAIAVVYIVAGIRLLRKVTSSGSQTGMSKRKQNLRRVTTLIVLCAIALACMVLAWLIYSASLNSAPANQYLAWWLVFGTQYTVSLCLILVFKRPTPENNSGSSDHPNTSDKGEGSKDNEMELPSIDQDSNRSIDVRVSS